MLFLYINLIYIITCIPGRNISNSSTSTIFPSASAVGSESGDVMQLTSATSVEAQNFAESKYLDFRGF